MTTTTPTDASADDLVQRLMDARSIVICANPVPTKNSDLLIAAYVMLEAVNRIRALEHRMCASGKASADRIEHLQAQLAEAQARVEATTQERDDMLRLMLGLPFGRSIDDKDLAWARDAITQQRAAMSGKETTR